MKFHKTIDQVFQSHIHHKKNALLFLVELVGVFRRAYRHSGSIPSLMPLISAIKENPEYLDFLKQVIYEFFKDKRKIELLTDAALIDDLDFFKELYQRISYKIVPSQPPKNSIQYAFNQIFYSSLDIRWIRRIPKKEMLYLASLLGQNNIYSSEKTSFVVREIITAALILSQRMGGLSQNTNVKNLIPEFNDLESPFIAFDKELNQLCQRILSSQTSSLNITDNQLDFKQLNVLSHQCEAFINQAFDNSSKYGISLKINQTLLLIQQQIKRIQELYSLLFTIDEKDQQEKTIDFILKLITYNSTKNNIRQLINDSIYNVTYEITTHTGKTGEHYITSGKEDYIKMFKTAAWGGVIVAFLCIFKVMISKTEMSDFGHALGYSINYALGFITIYLTGSTLATKQPAMTASTIAHSLQNINLTDKKSKGIRYSLFAELFSKVFRSQFIAFVGNVFLAFPVALILVTLFQLLLGENLAQSKAEHLLADLNIWETPVVFHAFIAGVYLFISGIISGDIANRNKYTKLYYRISEHPLLKRTIGHKRAVKLSVWMEKKWPGVVSNMWFGIFMGTTFAVGNFLGVDLNVRHITFASGNFALGLYGSSFHIALSTLLWCIIGIGIIGFINFIVSFTLSILVALRSLNIPMGELKNMAVAIFTKFRENPYVFFFPPKNNLTENTHNL